MKPYDSLTVRGVPIKRIQAVALLGEGQPLEHSTRCAIVDSLLSAEHFGQLRIQVLWLALDPYATVIAVDIAPANDKRRKM